MGRRRRLASDLRTVWSAVRRGGLHRHVSPRGTLSLARALLSGRQDLFVAVAKHAADTPRRIAIADHAGPMTWRTLADCADRGARGLAAIGVRPGERVAVVSANRAEWFVASAAIGRLGAVPAAMSPASSGPEIRDRMDRMAAAIVEPHLARSAVEGIGDPGRVIVLPPLPGRVTPARPPGTVPWSRMLHGGPRIRRFGLRRRGDADVVLYTSGTSGRSKGTRIRMRDANPVTALRYLDLFGIGRHTVMYTPCPLYHAAPMLMTGLTMLCGGTVVVRPRFEESEFVHLVHNHAITHAFLVPALLERVSRMSASDLDRLRRSGLRAVLSSGSVLRPVLKTRLMDQLGPILFDFYGATELGLVSIATPQDMLADPDAIGRILPGVETRLVDEGGREVPDVGELQVRSDLVSDGYDDEPSQPRDRWMSVGDVARLDGDVLYLLDRKRDIVISGGVNIFPREVEEALEQHPDVREAAAAGVDDARWGEALHAFVVLEDGADLDAEALAAHCRQQLSRFKVPKAFHAVAELPRSPAGKVLRRQLRVST